MSTTQTDQKQALREYVDSLGMTYTATFLPMKQPVETVKNPQLHWHIALTNGSVSATFPYFEGMAHVKGYQQYHKTKFDQRQAEDCYRATCETGKLYRPSMTGDFPRWTNGVQPAPDVLDVLYCLVSDASVRHSAAYEEWAPDYGYDIDSRKGEEVYRACQKQTTDLLRVLGGGRVGREALDRLEKLEELFQDY